MKVFPKQSMRDVICLSIEKLAYHRNEMDNETKHSYIMRHKKNNVKSSHHRYPKEIAATFSLIFAK